MTGYKVCAMMHKGPRPLQEDALLLAGRIVQADEVAVDNGNISAPSIFMVCDGVGGASAGEVASRLVCEVLRELHGRDPDNARQVLDILEKARDAEGMPEFGGTTVAGIWSGEKSGFVFNAGDSRVWRVEDTVLRRLTHDHSLVQSLVDSGRLSEDEAFGHPQANIIEFGIGRLFREEWENIAPNVIELLIAPKDRFLIASDGVHDVLREAEILDILNSVPFEEGAENLLQAIIERGLKDNTSFIYIEVCG